MCGKELLKELQSTVSHQTTIKHEDGSFEADGGVALGVGQIESDRLSQHTAASDNCIWNVVYGSRICTLAR